MAAVRFVPAGWRPSWAAIVVASVAVGLRLWSARLAGPPLTGAALDVLAILALVMAEASLLRSALAPGGPAGFAGLRWGRAETRLLATWALSLLFLAIIALLVFVAALCAAYAVASAGAGFAAARPATWAAAVDARGRLVLAGVALAGGACWSGRASASPFAPVATVARARVQVLAAWPLARGIAGRLVVWFLILGAAPAAAFIGLDRAVHLAPSAASAALPALAAGFVTAGLWLPLNAGLMTYLYLRRERLLSRAPAED